MNAAAHNHILRGAFEAIQADLRASFATCSPLLEIAGNYPDLFDDPNKSEGEKRAIDPDWERFCLFPKGMAGPCLHRWPHAIAAEQPAYQPVVEHWLREAIAAFQSRDLPGFVKFIGCLSHFEGDTTQPAHLLGSIDGMKLLEELVPAPAHLANFNYHVDLEAVTGTCGPLAAPCLLGVSVEEAAWRLCALNTRAVREMKRYIVPTLQAIFAKETKKAESLAEPPVTRAAQLTADLLFTAIRLANEDISESEKIALTTLDLRTWPADEESHDLVYGARAVLDGNCRIPPYPGPVVPAALKFEDGKREVKGLGMLPHSGLAGPKEAWMRWNIPPGVFVRFASTVGLHADLAVRGSVNFSVDLDGERVWDSGRLVADTQPLQVSLPLGRSRTITIKVTDANNGSSFWNNHAIWALPHLAKE